MEFDEKGREILDPTPVAIPLGFGRPESLEEKMHRMVRSYVSAIAQNNGHESFEEADDFEVEDDDTLQPSSPHELRELDGVPRWQEKEQQRLALQAAQAQWKAGTEGAGERSAPGSAGPPAGQVLPADAGKESQTATRTAQ